MSNKKNKMYHLMRILFNKSKGQVRGIDFALALVIYLFILTNVFVMIASFYDPSFRQLSSVSKKDELNTIFSTLFELEGSPVDWQTYPTSVLGAMDEFQPGFSGGLLHDLDATKIARLAGTAPGDWYLNYETLVNGLGLTKNDLAISIAPVFYTSILDLTFDGGTNTLSGVVHVEKNGLPLENTRLWITVIDSALITTEITGTTNNAGNYTFSTSVNPSNLYAVVAFAIASSGDQSHAMAIIDNTNVEQQFLQGAILMEDITNTTSRVRIISQPIGDEAKALVLFPHVQAYTPSEEILNSTTLGWEGSLGAPLNGTVVTVIGYYSGGTFLGFSAVSAPVYLTLENGLIYGPFDAMSNEVYSRTEIMEIRNILVEVTLWYW